MCLAASCGSSSQPSLADLTRAGVTAARLLNKQACICKIRYDSTRMAWKQIHVLMPLHDTPQVPSQA